MTTFEIYLILQLDSIREVFLWLTGISLGAYAFAFFAALNQVDKLDRADKKLPQYAQGIILSAKWVMPVLILMMIAANLIPSTRTMAAAIIIPRIVNNEQLMSDAEDVYALAVERMKELIKPTDVVHE